jgi:hypothetical protein
MSASSRLLLLSLVLATPRAEADPGTSTTAGAKAPGPVQAVEVPAPSARPSEVRVLRDDGGFKLQVDGRDFFVRGMNWSYLPVGENYSYDFWGKPDAFIEAALARELPLLTAMGVNAIRQYVGIPARWIAYIHRRYGIYTVLNHPVGRYGHSIDGEWVSSVDYSDPRTREVLTAEVVALVDAYRDTPGLLLWLLGNENNYGLFWASAEIEDLPLDRRDEARATHLYSLFGEIIRAVKARDAHHPVAIANGDLQFAELIARHCEGLDILGSNVYRGRSARDIFERTRDELGLPFMYTEFGADAFDAAREREDPLTQAEYLRAQWQEVYEHSHGKGRAGNAIGGFVFQWSDEWWKYLQEFNLAVHDTHASWANGGYPEDLLPGEDNMNEEWFGICAKTPSGEDGLYEVRPRAAYYLLQAGFRLDPYAPTTDLAEIRRHWEALKPADFAPASLLADAQDRLARLERLRLSTLRLELFSFASGGARLSDEERARTRIQHQESLYAGVTVAPGAGFEASASVNVLGGVASNPIDEIYFENRGRPVQVRGADGKVVTVQDANRVKLYQASLSWKTRAFEVEGFHRVGHGHWAYEGDTFGLFPEAHYQPAIDTFNADAPTGLIFSGKKALEGLKLAIGPELWWGANPALLAKYHRRWGDFGLALVHHEDLAQRDGGLTSSALPQPTIRRSSVLVDWRSGGLQLSLAGLLSGTNRVGRAFTAARESQGPGYLASGYDVLDDQVRLPDALGGKVKLTYSAGRTNFYLQAGYKGLVADAGADQAITFTGWSVREAPQGNHYHLASGATFGAGWLQIAPNVLFQRPLEGPLPVIADLFDPATGRYYPGVRARNQLQDPFWVRSNREQLAFELLLALDPTPATWMWSWDNVMREDARLAAFLDLVYRVLPTSQDAAIGVNAEGAVFAFTRAPPARNLWEVRARTVSRLADDVRLVLTGHGGLAQANGDSARAIRRAGVETRLIWGHLNWESFLRVNDWGPYDYHRDFDLTFPLQVMTDLSWALAAPAWFVPGYTRLGARGKLRFLDENSPRSTATSSADPLGREWEVLTYVQVAL